MVIVNLILLVNLAFGNRLLEEGYTHERTAFGGSRYLKFHAEDFLHSVIEQPHFNDVSSELIKRFNDRLSGESSGYDLDSINCNQGEGPDYYRMIPQFKAAPKIAGGPLRFSTNCFNEVTVEVTSSSSDSVSLSITTHRKSSLLCYDSFMIAILDSIHLDTLAFEGTHIIEFRNLNANDLFDVTTYGVRVFTFCDGIKVLLEDLFMTLKLFLGGVSQHPDWPVIGSHTPEYMEKANVEFLQRAIGYTMEARPVYDINLPESEIHSGDFLAITRLDGLDEMIMYGTGSRVGHSTMALWVEEDGVRELYVVESQDGWYWPRHGLQMNKYKQWLEWASNASFNIALLPLKQEYRDIFDEKAVLAYFKTVEGMPYGYHNFLFGWIDTVKDNLPPMLSPEFLTIGFRLAEKIIPGAIGSIFGEAMNKRLGTQGLSIPELEVEAGKKGLSLPDVMAIPEKDGWWYSDGYSYVCSSFVLKLYLEAGILGDLDLQGTEFTPRDVYSLNLFDTQYNRHPSCVESDPNIPYCMVIGKYRIDLGKDYGSIAPYDHMDETCPSVAPYFIRPDGC